MLQPVKKAFCYVAKKEPTKPAKLEVLDDYNVNLTISEGRYHQVKRMFAALGNKSLGYIVGELATLN